jgi:hypothetical protein
MATTGAPLQRPLWAPTVTVTGATAVTLLSLIRAKGGIYANMPGSSRMYQIQPDPTNTDTVLVGDENVAISALNCGVKMPAGSSLFYAATSPALAPIGSLYVLAASGSQLLNVMVASE